MGEAIDVIRGIWDVADTSRLRVDGRYYRVDGAKRGPAPAHDIGIWLGAYKPRMLRLRLRTSSMTLLTPGILASDSPRAISGTAPSTSFRVRRWPSEVSYTQNSAIPM